MNVMVRPVEETDFEEWRPLWEGYLEFYGHPIESRQVTELWERLMQQDPELYCRTAVDENGRLIGLVHYLFHATTWTTRPKCYLQDLYVDPDSRIGGAGRALIETVYHEATTAGAGEVYWNTQEFNSIARVLYDRVGEKTPFIKYRKFL